MDQTKQRARLIARRTDIEAVANEARAAGATVELDQTRVGRLSRMDAMQGQAMAKATGARRALELERIAAALARIDAGEYGDCQACGEPIAPARLEFDPAAVVCIHCAEAAEARRGTR
ncbi:MAG: TraR/DksA C4-type zinc finger protein [Gammaproteobacteria bacterium]|nr:TraR/DksA C4-type zinc finger protein [Gammaproteobacteria bacterium]